MKSRVHRTATLVDVSFKDVLGCDEAKEQLEDIVSYLKHQEKFASLGASLPKGVLLVGAPGKGEREREGDERERGSEKGELRRG